MEDLTKTQIVLLCLLLSFVTSIATGIISFSLLDQAPKQITQTINRVVERTIEKVTPIQEKPSVITKEVTVVVKEEDLVIDAIEKNAKSIVRIRGANPDGTTELYSLGLVVSKDGDIITDKSRISSAISYTATFFDNKIYPLSIISAGSGNQAIAVLRASRGNETYAFHPASFKNSDLLQLGQTVIAISGEERNTVAIGRISGILTENAGETPQTKKITTRIETDIAKARILGGPIVNLSGEIIGIKDFQADSLKENSYLSAAVIQKEILGKK